MAQKGFVTTVEDMFKLSLSLDVAHGLETGIVTGTHKITYDVAKDVFIFSDLKGKDFEGWNGDFYLVIYTRIHHIFKQSSFEGKLTVPGDVIRNAIKAEMAMYIGKQHKDMQTPGSW